MPNGTIEWANGRADGHEEIRAWVGGLMAAGIDSSGNVTVPSVGSYTDTVVKVDGKWLFEKRIMAADLGVFGREPD